MGEPEAEEEAELDAGWEYRGAWSSAGPEPPELSDWFWELIASAHGDVARMQDILDDELSVADLLRFHYELEDAVCEFQDEAFSQYLTGSEDGAIDVANWVVSQGRDYYYEIFAHPERIPEDVEWHPRGVLHDGITLGAYYERTGDFPPDRDD